MAIDDSLNNNPNNDLPKDKGELLSYWKEQVRLGCRYKQLYGRSKEWKTYKNAYRNFFAPNTVPVNIIYAVGRSLVPQIYFRNPRVSIIPKKPGYAMHARVLERVDNYLIKELNIKDTMKSEILDCYLCGRGFGILGYDSEYGYNPSFAATEILGESTEKTLTQYGSEEQRIEYNLNVKPGMPWFLRCNPNDFIVPWGTYSWESAPWFAFRKMRLKRDILEDPKYSNTKNIKGLYKSNLDIDGVDGATQTIQSNSELSNEYIELWEIHDQRSGYVYVVSLDHDDFLRNEFDELQIEGLNALPLGFNEDPDYFWWTPDARLIMQQQYELNDIRTMAKAHRRVALLKVLYDKGLVGKEALEKLLDGDPKAAVPIDVGPQGDIRKAVALLQGHIHPDLAMAAREVREDVREIVGFSRNQMGSFEESSGRRTAYEAAVVKQASMIRVDERRDICADYLEKIIHGMNQIIFKNWTGEKIIDIIGPDGVKYWVRFTGKEIKGDFAYSIQPEEATPQSQSTRRQEAAAFIPLIQQIPGANMKYIMETYASTFDWIDPKMLFPGEGEGRSPEKAMLMSDLLRKGQAMGQGGGSPYPALDTGSGLGITGA